ncbi:MAG: radical SAM protein [Lentisphaerae bacterium]|nr:radical SAM protein [Lentisphaerota bacterium]
MPNNYDIAVTEELRRDFRARSRGNLRRVKSLKDRHFNMGENDTLTVVVCQGCGIGCRSCSRSPVEPATMDGALLNRLIDYAVGNFHSISLTGGEPTDCMDLYFDIAGRHADLRVNVTTNGEGFSDETIAGIAEYPNVYPIISINGSDAAVHDASRHPGSFDEVVRGIERLRERRVPFGALTMINRTNLEQVLTGELAGFVDMIGACTLETFQYHPLGESEEYRVALRLSDEAAAWAVEYRNRLFADNPYAFLFKSAQPAAKRCARELQVFLNGEVSYCPFSVWGFEKIEVPDSDMDIQRKLEMYRGEWEEMAGASPGYCPLQDHTAAFIEFFSSHGTQFFRPTGILA